MIDTMWGSLALCALALVVVLIAVGATVCWIRRSLLIMPALVLLAMPAAAQSPYYWLQPGYNPNVPQGWVAPLPPQSQAPCSSCAYYQQQQQPQPYYQPQYQPYYNPNSPYPPETYYEQYLKGGSAGCVYGCSDQ